MGGIGTLYKAARHRHNTSAHQSGERTEDSQPVKVSPTQKFKTQLGTFLCSQPHQLFALGDLMRSKDTFHR